MTKEDSERKKIYSNEYSGKNSNKKNNTSIDFKVEKILKEETPGSYKLFGGGFLSPITHMRRYLTKKRLLNKNK